MLSLIIRYPDFENMILTSGILVTLYLEECMLRSCLQTKKESVGEKKGLASYINKP